MVIRIQLAHLIGNDKQLTVQLLRVRRIDLLREHSANRVSGAVPCRIAGPPPNVAMFLPPTGFRRPQRMVTSYTGTLRILLPHILFIGAFILRPPPPSLPP